jgi:hypothetical protein
MAALRLDPSLEFFVQTLDRVGDPAAALLARRQACEGEEAITSVFGLWATARHLSRHLRIKALRRFSIGAAVAA